jgi:hypothetical protein
MQSGLLVTFYRSSVTMLPVHRLPALPSSIMTSASAFSSEVAVSIVPPVHRYDGL